MNSKSARGKIADNWLPASKLESVCKTENNGDGDINLQPREPSDEKEACQLRTIVLGEDGNLITIVTKMRSQLDLRGNEDEWKSPTWNYATVTDTPQSEAEDELDELAIESEEIEGNMHIAYMPTDALMCSKVTFSIFLSSRLYYSLS